MIPVPMISNRFVLYGLVKLLFWTALIMATLMFVMLAAAGGSHGFSKNPPHRPPPVRLRHRRLRGQVPLLRGQRTRTNWATVALNHRRSGKFGVDWFDELLRLA